MKDIINHYRTLIGEALQAIDGETLGIKAMALVERAGIELNALGDRVNPAGARDPWHGWQDIGWLDEAQGFFIAATEEGASHEAFGTYDLSAYIDEIDKATRASVDALLDAVGITPMEWQRPVIEKIVRDAREES
jgi:hypothetical protein